MYFVCKDSATTEFYTYCHPLSLHDALPISPELPPASCSREPSGSSGRPSSGAVMFLSCSGAPEVDAPAPGLHLQAPVARSEEHTSELQSLMRISYAVLCLKKKKT